KQEGKKMKGIAKRVATIFLMLAVIFTFTPFIGDVTDGAMGAQDVHAASIYKPSIDMDAGYVHLYIYTPYAGSQPTGIGEYTQVLHPVDGFPRLQIVETWEDMDGNEVKGTFEEGNTYTYKAVIQSVAGTAATAPDIRKFDIDVYHAWTGQKLDWGDATITREPDVKGKNYIVTYTAVFKAKAPQSRDKGAYTIDLRDGKADVDFRDEAVSQSFEYLTHIWGMTSESHLYDVAFDVDLDGTYDIGLIADDMIEGGLYQAVVVPGASMKTKRTTVLHKDYQKSLDMKDRYYYSKVTVIIADPVNIKSASVSGIKSKTYTGKVIKPTPVVKLKGSKLEAGTDYTVTIKNSSGNEVSSPKKVGKYTVYIKGKGDYTGTITKSYKINPEGTTLKAPKYYKKGKTFVTVKWNKQAAKMSVSRITGYQVQVATNKSFTTGKKTALVKGYSKVSKKFTKLKSGKKYYVRIRTYKTVNGVTCYSPWSTVKTVTTKE
ncbi:MAG: fibronectin type III domain-containing protein, partial [Lachnospiraceae bacterium]|nr:fibronectin type III domain-containing protein [Lachnospiraceae bacterium]